MSIFQQYQGKLIAIMNAESVIGKVLLKKIIIHVLDKVKTIVIIDTHTRNQIIPQQKLYQELIQRDLYLKHLNSHKLKDKIEFVRLTNQDKYKFPIDILFNCHIPQDFTRNSVQKILKSHVWKTKQICQFLCSNINIIKTIMVSSIHSQNFGYVAESDDTPIAQPLGYMPEDLISSAKLKQQLMDRFSNDYQIWQWSTIYMQKVFATQSGSRSADIVRLPLIGPTLQNYEGFVVGFNTLTSLIYQIGKKQIDALQGNSNNIIDMIPADFVANYIITIAVVNLNEKQIIPKHDILDQQQQDKSKNIVQSNQNVTKPKAIKNVHEKVKVAIHNLSTSSRNPISLSKFGAFISEGWIQYSSEYYKPMNFKVQQKRWERKAYAIQSKLPNNAKARLAHLFDIKSWKIQSQQSAITTNKKFETMRKYRFFLQHQWICESNKSIDYFYSLSNQDQFKLNFNVNSINWKTYAKLCCYAINKYLLNIQVQQFNPASLDLLNLQKSSYFSDIVWALTQGKPINTQNLQQIKNYILSTKSVKQAVQLLVEEQSKKLQQTPTAYEKVQQQFYKIADQICTQMFSQYSMSSIRGFAWFLHKVFRSIYEKVVVDKKAIMKLKNRDEKVNGPLIIIPTHRSYIDFLIMSYVFFGYGIKVPHIAAAQDFLNMAIVHILLRKSGAFFIKRDQKKYRNLYKAIMSEYISKLLGENHYLQFFIEGTRSRVGKMLQPKYGILSIVCKNVLDGKIPDAQILPVTINYQKILQGTSFTYELMGETKVKQSLSRLIKAVDVLKQNYGRIYIELCDTISVKDYFAKNMPKYADKRQNQYELTLNDFGYKILFDLQNSLVITPPAILSSIILMDRIGISDDRLSEKSQWLSRQIASRGIKVARTQSDSSISIINTLGLMGDIVNKSKKDMFEVQVSFDQNSFIQLFTLTYYRNTLTHIFFQQALIAVTMASFGYQDMTNCKVKLQYLKKGVDFLAKLLRKQYVLQKYIGDHQDKFEEVLQQMSSKGVVQILPQQEKNSPLVGITNPESNIFVFYCSLIWPIVQSYWICVLYLFKLIKDNASIEMPKLQSEIQWFGQSLFTQRIILHLQAISMDTIKNATFTLKQMKIIGQAKEKGSSGVKVLVDESILKAFQRKIQAFLKSKYASSLKGTLGSGRSSVTLDFPFLSKL